MTIEVLNKDTINDFIKESEKPVLIDFWAYGCPPCDAIQPVLEKLSDQYNQIAFAKINVDENESIAPIYQLMSVPTLIVFQNGESIQRKAVPSVDQVYDMVENILS